MVAFYFPGDVSFLNFFRSSLAFWFRARLSSNCVLSLPGNETRKIIAQRDCYINDEEVNFILTFFNLFQWI